MLDFRDFPVGDFQSDREEGGDLVHHDRGVNSNSTGLRIGEGEWWAGLGGHNIPTAVGKGQLDGIFRESYMFGEWRLALIVRYIRGSILVADGGQASSIAAFAPGGRAGCRGAGEAREASAPNSLSWIIQSPCLPESY